MIRKYISQIKILTSFLLMTISMHSYCFILDGTLTGDDLKFRNVESSLSGDSTIADWAPSKNLLPAATWSPGFNYKEIKSVLVSQDGTSKVDISDAISVIGMEYRAYDDLKLSSQSLSGRVCPKGDNSGNTAYTISTAISPCHSRETFNSNGVMPFYFFRPILHIESSKIKDAFSRLPLNKKKEGIYSFTTSLVTPYFFKMENGVETWQNVTSILNININYKPAVSTRIRLKNPSWHPINFDSPPTGANLLGSTKFTVIAEGTIPNGLTLTIPKSNHFYLVNNDHTVASELPISVECGDCATKELVKQGHPIVQTTTVNRSGNYIEFPIDVKVETPIKNVSFGDYKGTFTLVFGLNIG
ncbi:hypothetical protein [Photobacterium damselae]|uniref:hypothetical protein n=1 Tax=Photobacterium damselae TaxID=38293 RepID=UPI001EDDF41D|nr:hypothetical protein [Photobacterium damselae]MCG3846596.1 hypothetical protein [Photobacterium damselae]